MVLSLSLYHKQLHIRHIAPKKLQFQVHLPILHLQAFSVDICLLLEVNDLQIFDYYGEYNLIWILLFLHEIQVIQSIRDLNPKKIISIRLIFCDIKFVCQGRNDRCLNIFILRSLWLTKWIAILSNNSSLYLLCAFFLPQSLLRNK